MNFPRYKLWLLLGAISGLLAVALGAFGAHGLETRLEKQGYEGLALRDKLAPWETAAHYQLVHAVVLLVIIVAAIAWMPATRWRSLTTEVAASAFYLENWQLMRSAVDYLARDSAPSPLQHFWALAVQGQFYLVWPFLILLSGLLARLLKRDGLPSLEDLAGWISVLNWVLGWEHRGASLFEQALTSGRDPATCYRLVKRITGATWITVRNHGSGWVVLQLRDRCVIPKPGAHTAHQQDHGRASGSRRGSA